MRHFLVLYRRTLREFLRVPISVFVIPLVLPVFILTIFSRVFSSVILVPGYHGTDRYLAYITPATLLMSAMLGSGTAGVSTAIDRQTGFHSRLRISAAGVSASHLARRLGDATRLGTFAMVLIVVAGLNGVPINNWPLALGMGAAFAAAWGLAYGGLSFSLCLRTGSPELSQALVPLFFPVLFLSTAFMPMELLPDWLQAIARYNPASYITDALRGADFGFVDWSSVWPAAGGTLLLGVITSVMVWRSARAVEGT